MNFDLSYRRDLSRLPPQVPPTASPFAFTYCVSFAASSPLLLLERTQSACDRLRAANTNTEASSTYDATAMPVPQHLQY
jgi:hypothetical protein